MSNTSMKRLIGTMALAGAALAASPAQAQEIQLRGPLAGARSVSRLVQHREGRFAVTPIFGISLLDEFSRDLFFGVRAEYHFTDWLGLGVMGAFAPVHVNTSLTEQVGARSPAGTVNVPYANPVPQVDHAARRLRRRRSGAATGWPTSTSRSSRCAASSRSFRASSPTSTSSSSRARPSWASRSARTPRSTPRPPTCSAPRARPTAPRAWPSPRPSAPGLNFYITRFLSINFEYRATPFQWNRSGTDENSTASLCGSDGRQSCAGFSDYVSTYFNRNPAQRQTVINSDDRSWSFNQMFTIGLTVFLPTSPRVGP